jgi:putative transposase
MKTIHRTYRYLLQPTKKQEVSLNKHFGCVRWVYNRFLNERIEQYKQTGKWDNYYKQKASLAQVEIKEETAWLKQVNSQSLQSAVLNLEAAFINFFKGRAKFPRFKSKKAKTVLRFPSM